VVGQLGQGPEVQKKRGSFDTSSWSTLALQNHIAVVPRTVKQRQNHGFPSAIFAGTPADALKASNSNGLYEMYPVIAFYRWNTPTPRSCGRAIYAVRIAGPIGLDKRYSSLDKYWFLST
jgi:hypothetical protein